MTAWSRALVAIDWALRLSCVSCLALSCLHYRDWAAISRSLRRARTELARAVARVERTLPALRHSLIPEDARMRLLRLDYEVWARLPQLPSWDELQFIALAIPSLHAPERAASDGDDSINSRLLQDELLQPYFRARDEVCARTKFMRPVMARGPLAAYELAIASAVLFVASRLIA